MKNKIGFIFVLLFTILFFGANIKAAETLVLSDPQGDVAGVRCDTGKEGRFFDLLRTEISSNNNFFLFRWIISGDESGALGCDISFWAGIDVDEDRTIDYRALYTLKECSLISSTTVLYDAADQNWPPKPIYIFQVEDYAVFDNILDLRVPRKYLKTPGTQSLPGNTVNIHMGVGDENTSCNDDIGKMISYSMHEVKTSADFVYENNIRILTQIAIILIVLVGAILIWYYKFKKKK